MISKEVARAKKFIKEDLWKVKVSRLPKRKANFYRFIRVITITFTEFTKDKCAEKASALTYFTLISIVPVIAMAFGIAKSFGLKSYLETQMDKYFSGQEEVLEYVKEYSNNMLDTSNGGIITGISAVFLIYAVGRLLNNIEVAFNDVWDTKKGRSFQRKITDYTAVILLGPIILIISSSVTAYVVTSIENLTSSIEILGFFRPAILFLIRLFPYTLIWLLFFLMFLIFPNTRVKIKPALIGGIVAGTAFQLTQIAWINGQVYLTRYSDIYGLVAALPLFMIWLQLSWTIILLGAELSFAIQNVKMWSYDNEDLVMNRKSKKRFTLVILKEIVRHFEQKNEPLSFQNLFKDISIPRRFVMEILRELLEAKMIVRVATNDDEDDLYVPGMDINKMDIIMVFSAIESRGISELPQQSENEGFDEISKLLDTFDEYIKKSKHNQLIKNL